MASATPSRRASPGGETIAAISTPVGEGAIALIRISGPGAIPLADEIFEGRIPPSQAPSKHQLIGRIHHRGTPLDTVVLSVNRAPKSYTGEDLVEITCHGGILVTRQLLTVVLGRGARAAHPGEFTERAFLHGKMDLTQAEAVMDVIRARTSLALRSAAEQLSGNLGQRILALRDNLLNILAHVEATIDFPEEGISPATGAELQSKTAGLINDIKSLLATAEQGRILREGLRTVICGAPNVGKSSLLNRLLGYERAIVNPNPGTTRDTIEEVINLQGIPVRLTDTAGLRTDAADAVEVEGMERTRRSLEYADLVLHVVDGSQPPPARFAPATETIPCILVANKSDLGGADEWMTYQPVSISCVSGEGMVDLEQAVFDRVSLEHIGGSAIAINARHQACLSRAAEAARQAADAFGEGRDPELIALDLRAALEALGEIVGRVETEELLGVIFSQFCIGK